MLINLAPLRKFIPMRVKDFTRTFRMHLKFNFRISRIFYGRYFGLLNLDQQLENYMNYKGGYFELGANNGLSQSNTKYFELFKGWKGVLVEPYEANFKKCFNNRKKSTLIFHAACVPFGFPENEIELLYSNLMTLAIEGTNDIWNRNQHAEDGIPFLEPHEKVHKFKAPARTLNSILEEADSPYLMDFLSLDVEGGELGVLKGLNHAKYRFKWICVESREPEELNKFLGDNSYTLVETLSGHYYLYKYVFPEI